MKNSLYIGLKNERLKIKRTWINLFTIASAIFIPLVYFLVYFFRTSFYIPKEGMNIWDNYFGSSFTTCAPLLFPLFITLLVAININIEHKENAWKKLLILPISRTQIYTYKVIFLLIQLFLSLLIFLCSYYVFGLILGFTRPELMFLEHTPSVKYYFTVIARWYISALGIFALQFVLSLFIKNIIVPLAVGVFGTVMALVVTSWEYIYCIPYASGILFSYNMAGRLKVASWHGFVPSDLVSIVLFIILTISGAYYFNKKQYY